MMNEIEISWLTLCRNHKDRFCIDVDTDSVFVTDLESGECAFEFRHFGWEMVIDLLRYIGCNAEEV